ncbi:hypothetical protein PM082_021412 [Marasmius tenuissimus]|nr:hypothetical protein PM082_021412 [Marasmius tenuissimus]
MVHVTSGIVWCACKAKVRILVQLTRRGNMGRYWPPLPDQDMRSMYALSLSGFSE